MFTAGEICREYRKNYSRKAVMGLRIMLFCAADLFCAQHKKGCAWAHPFF